jgi:hypothetical protein
MPFNHGLRLNNRQRIANAREKPMEANKNQSVDGAEGLFLRSGSPQKRLSAAATSKFPPQALSATETDLRPSRQRA